MTTEFPPLTDKQLMVLEILAKDGGDMEDIDIAPLLGKRLNINYGQAKAAVPPLLGALKKLGLVKRAQGFDPDLNYGVWSLSDHGKRAMGIQND